MEDEVLVFVNAYRFNPDKEGFVEYRVCVSRKTHTQWLWRRYSEFYALNKNLSQKYPEMYRPKEANFPAKYPIYSFFFGMSRGAIEQRLPRLSEYMLAVSTDHESIWKEDESWKQFIGTYLDNSHRVEAPPICSEEALKQKEEWRKFHKDWEDLCCRIELMLDNIEKSPKDDRLEEKILNVKTKLRIAEVTMNNDPRTSPCASNASIKLQNYNLRRIKDIATLKKLENRLNDILAKIGDDGESEIKGSVAFSKDG